MFWTASGIAQPQCHGHLADGKDGHGIIHPKSVIRPTIGLDYLFLYCLFICFGVLFAVFLPVSSRHSTLCLRQYGRNTTNITSKTFMNSNDRFGSTGHIHKYTAAYSRICTGIFTNIRPDIHEYTMYTVRPGRAKAPVCRSLWSASAFTPPGRGRLFRIGP